MYRAPDRDDVRGVVTEIGGYIDVGECPDHWAHWDHASKIKHLADEPTGTQPGPDWDNRDQPRLDASGVGIGTHGSGSRSSLPEAASTRRRSLQGSAVLALDLGQSTGWAMRTVDGLITSGTVQFRPSRFEGGGMVFLRFRAWLQELDETAGGIGVVFFEEVRRHVGTAAAHAYGGYLAHLTAWAEALKLPYEGVPVGTIKRHATGKGNAGKDEVIAAMRARGFAPGDDNEADALALLDWAVTNRVGGAR